MNRFIISASLYYSATCGSINTMCHRLLVLQSVRISRCGSAYWWNFIEVIKPESDFT